MLPLATGPLLTLLCLAMLGGIGSGAGQRGGDEAIVRAQLEEIRKQAEAPKNGPFDRLAALRSRAGFEGLKRALGSIASDVGYRMLFGSISAYADVAALEEDALRFTAHHADSHTDAIAGAAARHLPAFGAAGKSALWAIAATGSSRLGRAYAIGSLRDDLIRAGDAESLGIVLGGARVPESGSHDELNSLLREFDAPFAFEMMADLVADPRADPARARLILRALGGHAFGIYTALDAGVASVLTSALSTDDPALQFHALVVATDRRTVLDHALLERLSRSPRDELRGAAFAAGAGPPGALFDPRTLVQSRDPVARQAGVASLARFQAAYPKEALPLIHARFGDDDSVVRLEAIRAAEKLRRKESIPHLIKLLKTETGRLRGDARDALQRLTARPFGLGHRTWSSFWSKEGEGFKVPSPREVREAELAARERKKAGSRAEFYGVEVLSNRFALVVDTSGSMLEPAYLRKTRIAVAKGELLRVLEQLPEGTLYNVISFDAVARPLYAHLNPVRKAGITRLRKHVRDLRADGGTNLYGALRAAFDDPEVDTIYLVTDGDPSVGEVIDPEELRDSVLRWNHTRRIAIHSIAIGQGRKLLQRLSLDSGGSYRIVY